MNLTTKQAKRLHLTCTRCGYTWLRRDLENLPKNCANKECKSPAWDKAKRASKSVLS